MDKEKATETLDNFKRQVAARVSDAKIAHLAYVGFWYTDRGLESFVHKITHPLYEVSSANELGEALFAATLDNMKRLPGAEIGLPSKEVITVIPDAPALSEITNETFRVRDHLDNLVTDGAKLKRQCTQIEEMNGRQFLQDFCECAEIVCALTWSDYYMSVTKYSIWFAAQFFKVPYEMLPPKSQHNGSDQLRMLVKYI